MSRRVVATRAILVLSVLTAMSMLAGAAFAQVQTPAQRKCSDTMGKSLRKVSALVGKQVDRCLKEGAAAGPAPAVSTCLALDPGNKIADAEAKTFELFANKCSGTDLAPFGVGAPTEINAAARSAVLDLLSDTLAPDPDLTLLDASVERLGSLCQRKLLKLAGKCQDKKRKEFARCTKLGLKDALTPFDDATSVEACLGSDPMGRAAKACDLVAEPKPGKFKLDPIRRTLIKQCQSRGVDLAPVLPGCDVDDVELSHACMLAKIDCHLCRTLNAAAGLARDCDEFDDGAVNGSCGAALCEFDDTTSGFIADLAGGVFIPGSLTGSVAIDCGTSDPVSTEAPCSCTLVQMDPVEVFGIGFACFQSAPGCELGRVDCDGGSPFDVDITTTHDIGACSGNADCAAQCTTHCAASGGSPFDSGCEGFCAGGGQDGMPCAADALCPGGTCNGLDGTIHGNVCGCHCLETSGGSAPGAMRCNLGVEIAVEQTLPCDGADVLIPVGTSCVPFTTEFASSVIEDGNAVPGNAIPGFDNSIPGMPLTCSDRSSLGLSGMDLVSSANFLDAPVAGDMAFQFALGCR